jgi:hypothetical protein
MPGLIWPHPLSSRLIGFSAHFYSGMMRAGGGIELAGSHAILTPLNSDADTPLERVPDDVLLCVAAHAVQDDLPYLSHARTVLALASVSRRFRALVLGTPTLWTHIDSRWPADVQHTFAARAAAAALRLHFESSAAAIAVHMLHGARPPGAAAAADGVGDGLLAETAHTLRWLTRAVSVTGRFYVQAQWALFFATLNRGAPCLRDLRIEQDLRGRHAVFAWAEATLDPRACPRLSALTLDLRVIEGMPHMPALRRLGLLNVECGLALVQQACARVPGVEDLTVRQGYSWMHNPVRGPVRYAALARLELPRLQRLAVAGQSRWLPHVLAFLPHPAAHLNVCTDWVAEDDAWSSTTAAERATIAHVHGFWAHASGTDGAWPAGTVRVDGLGVHVIFGAARPGSAPSFLYEAVCQGIGADPLLAHVRVLELEANIHSGESIASLLDPQRITLENLSAAQTLILRRADFTAANEYDQVSAVWKWVEGRHRSGNPLSAIRFEECFDETGIFARLVDSGLALAISGEGWRSTPWKASGASVR